MLVLVIVLIDKVDVGLDVEAVEGGGAIVLRVTVAPH